MQLLERKRNDEMAKIKALFLAANPAVTERLALDEEIRLIEEMMRKAKYRNTLVFQSAWAVRPDDLLQLLNEHQPHIVHFSGHGIGDGLQLAAGNGEAKLVTTQALKRLFTTLKDNIRLILLNACYSQAQAEALVEVIDCVIGMNESIGDEAAAIFASSFYRALGFGRSVQNAFDQGLVALSVTNISEEDIPKLLVKDGVDPNQIVLVGGRKPQVASPAEVVSIPDRPAPTATLIPDQFGANRELEGKKSAVEVFISYSHKDKLLRDQLAIQLSNLRRQQVIRDWFDGDIIPGTEWRKQIQQHLESAQIILLLISADFMASEFCYSIEMTRAIQRHKDGNARVLPILLRPTDYEDAPFAELLMLPTDAKPITRWTSQDDAFENVIKGIRRAINELKERPPVK
jgi:TIR domain/CHAT domain